MAMLSFLLLSLIVEFPAVRVEFRKPGDPVHFGPDTVGECGEVQGEVPNDCGGQLLHGVGTELGCGDNGIAVLFQDKSGDAVVAKILQTPNVEDEDLPEEIAKSTNECAIMKFLQSQNVPNVLRCVSECTGKVQMDTYEEKGSVDTPVMITTPFVKDALDIGDMDIANVEALETARRQTLYTGAYMLAAGVVNVDLPHNVLHAPDGTTVFIDLGLAKIIHTKTEEATWEELDLNEYGFVTSEFPFQVPLSASRSYMRKHIDVVLDKAEVLGWPLIEEIWHTAWEAASACAYKVEGLREYADETMHGLRLLRAASYKDPTSDEAHLDLVKEALEAGRAHTGSIWADFKQEALGNAQTAVGMSIYYENLQGFEEIVELLS